MPQEHCTGGRLITDQQLGTSRCHISHDTAFRCMVQYLLKQGFEQIGAREFRSPEGGVRVLTKRSRYGARLKMGKEGTRFMPDERDTGLRGVIIG